jgi:hypothetical protein
MAARTQVAVFAPLPSSSPEPDELPLFVREKAIACALYPPNPPRTDPVVAKTMLSTSVARPIGLPGHEDGTKFESETTRKVGDLVGANVGSNEGSDVAWTVGENVGSKVLEVVRVRDVTPSPEQVWQAATAASVAASEVQARFTVFSERKTEPVVVEEKEEDAAREIPFTDPKNKKQINTMNRRIIYQYLRC